MAVTGEPDSEAFKQRDQELTERAEELRLINDRITALKAELDALNERARVDRSRRRPPPG